MASGKEAENFRVGAICPRVRGERVCVCACVRVGRSYRVVIFVPRGPRDRARNCCSENSQPLFFGLISILSEIREFCVIQSSFFSVVEVSWNSWDILGADLHGDLWIAVLVAVCCCC